VRWELVELSPAAGPDDPVAKQGRIVESSPGMVVPSVLVQTEKATATSHHQSAHLVTGWIRHPT
jgi:hypothetical protein